MMKKKLVSDKRHGMDNDDQMDNRIERKSSMAKQTKSSNNQTFASTTVRSSVSFASTSHHYTRSRSKSSVSYAESSKANKSPPHTEGPNSRIKHFNPTPSNISSSLINAFQMPQNIAQALPQVFPNININMSALPDYLSQLPSVSMPAMPIISMPNITMPSMPSLSMPSMPNLSMPNITMPSIPSISNINIPSFSDIMNFPGRKNQKSWSQIVMSVRNARKRYSQICPSIPFSFNFCYDAKKEKLRIYFLCSQNSPETTLFYCDVWLTENGKPPQNSHIERNNSTIFEIDEEMNLSTLDTNLNDFQKAHNVPNDETNLNHSYENGETIRYEASMNPELHIELDHEDYDMENSSKSASPPSLSSSASSGSFSHVDPSLLRKSVSSPTASVSDFPTLEWKPLILISRAFTDFTEDSSDFIQNKHAKSDFQSQAKASREEDLILQRKRILFSGVIAYDFHPEAARFVYTVKNMIFWFDDIEMIKQKKFDLNGPVHDISRRNHLSPESPPYIPHKLITNSHVKMNATMCPHNPDIVAYLADNDLWVCDLVSCKEMRLTRTDYMKTGIMAGRPSFVMQEEFSRFVGFWWRPSTDEDTYTILCEFVDESNVDIASISSWDGTSEFHRFPKAGCCNAKSTLKLVNFSLNALKTLVKVNNNSSFIEIQALPISLHSIFFEYEYLIRCDWYSPDVIWAQLLNRLQNKLVIVLISITNQFPAQIIFEETRKDHWFNCHDVFYFYRNFDENGENNSFDDASDSKNLTVGSKVKFLWSSEVTGFRHLYNITVELVGQPSNQMENNENNFITSDDVDSDPLQQLNEKIEEFLSDMSSIEIKSTLIFNQQLTNGNYEVSESMFWVDEERDSIYFVSNKDSPLENHLYVVSTSQSPRVQPRRITKEDFTHSRLIFDPEFRFCIDFQSNLTIPPFGYLHKVVQPEHGQFNLVSLEPIHYFLGLPEDVSYDESLEYCDKVQSLGPTPQLFEYKLESGELIYGFLFKPDFMEPGVKYPVLVEVYGGPEVQLVSKSFKEVRQHRRHMIASEGYIVVGFDSRGSKHRGVEFERYIYKRLGQVEINDQVEALEWLAANTGFIDMNRVAIHGWSYGGYLSLMALAQRGDIFKCAIAGAPVTNWLLYDTGYTERYMGLPDENEEGYRRSSVLSYIKHFPDEYNRLLIIHGLMDENVHFAHTAQLINGLITFSKPYDLNVFPFERHSLRKLYSSEHYEATLLYYLQQNL